MNDNLSDSRAIVARTLEPHVTGEVPLERVPGLDPIDFLPGQDHPVSQATPPAHPHRPESRREPRKPVLLMGTYRHQGQSDRLPVVIEDLSRSGVGMLSFAPDTLIAGDILDLQFGLEDSDQSVIETSVCVRWVHGDILGAQLLNPDDQPPAFFDFLEA